MQKKTIILALMALTITTSLRAVPITTSKKIEMYNLKKPLLVCAALGVCAYVYYRWYSHNQEQRKKNLLALTKELDIFLPSQGRLYGKGSPNTSFFYNTLVEEEVKTPNTPESILSSQTKLPIPVLDIVQEEEGT